MTDNFRSPNKSHSQAIDGCSKYFRALLRNGRPSYKRGFQLLFPAASCARISLTSASTEA